MNVLDLLRQRGLVENVTSPDLRQILESPLTVYAGFDPSSDSLQAGNYVTLMVLSHFQRAGHRVIALVGGATGLIGDPSGKASERRMMDLTEVERNVRGIEENLSRILDFRHPTAPAKIVNNMDWFRDFTVVDFLRDVGRHFRLGTMLAKETVKARLGSEAGMSFSEFCYPLLQAYDFLRLYDQEGCRLQVGGSDQWGNITAGIELIRRIRGVETYGLTTPLICDSRGQKFGKSEGNAIYLDARRTSCYAFYQFFLRTADADVIRFLRIFTHLPEAEIEELERRLPAEPEKREAQLRLAEEVTRAVHGEAGLEQARRASSALFGAPLQDLAPEILLEVFADVPSAELLCSEVEGRPVAEVVVKAGLCPSGNAARRLIRDGGLYVNNRRVEGTDARIRTEDLLGGHLLVLRSGKKTYHLVKTTSASSALRRG